jgi:hypothetical protein
MPRLECLDLSSTAITDEGLRHLSGLSSLLFLCLDYTQISDRGVAYLRDLPCLNTLYVDGTNVTNEGLRSLPAHWKVEPAAED